MRSREATYVLSLAWSRVRRRSSGCPARRVGIAVGTAVLVGVLAGTKMAQDRSASQAVERIPAVARSVRAVWFGVPGRREPGAPGARPHRANRARGPRPRRARRRSCCSGRARLPATSSRLRASTGSRLTCSLKSGRLPHRCTPSRCEVLRLRGKGAASRTRPGCDSCEVGTATLRSSQLFGDFLAPTDNALADREIAPAMQQARRVSPPAAGAARRRRRDRAAHPVRPALSRTRTAATRGYGRSRRVRRGCGRSTISSARSEHARAALSEPSRSASACRRRWRSCERPSGPRPWPDAGSCSSAARRQRSLFAFAVLAARTMRRDLRRHAAGSRGTARGGGSSAC